MEFSSPFVQAFVLHRITMCSSSSLSKSIHQTIKGAQRLGYDNYASDHSESLLALSSETIMRGHCAM